MKLIEDFSVIPRLGFLTGTKVIITIWNRSDIVRSISWLLETMDNITEVDRMWGEITDQVVRILQSIKEIPSLLLRDMEALIIPIGFHIRAMRTFANFNPYLPSSELEFPVNVWTPYGTVDIKRHDEVIVRDNRREISFRYNLACNDCFADVVEELFPFLTNRQKHSFRHRGRNRELLSYWTYRMSGVLSSFRNSFAPPGEDIGQHEYSADQLAFIYTLANGSKSGIEYFLNRLPPEESETVLNAYAIELVETNRFRPPFTGCLPVRPEEHFTDALYFLLSKMNEDWRNRLLREHSFLILQQLLMYPFFGLFSKYGTILMSNLTEENIYELLQKILNLESANTYFFGYELFNDLWSICPQTHKEYVISWNERNIFITDNSQRLMREAIRKAEET